jgi:arsenate reductase
VAGGTPYDPGMADVRIFHNPQCSKSRQTLELLADRGVDVEVVRYLDDPPTRADLERLLGELDVEPAALVRSGDPRFKELGLVKDDYVTAPAVVELLVEHPRLMERPVVERGGAARIGRPPEHVLEIL